MNERIFQSGNPYHQAPFNQEVLAADPPVIIPANQAPVINAPIDPQTMVSGAFISIPLTGGRNGDVFTDPDGDVLTYSINPAIPGVQMVGTQLVVIPSTPVGNYVINLIATDPGGLSVTHTIPLEVTAATPPNQDPVLTSPLPDINMGEGENQTVDLPDHMTDPDSDPLIFQVTTVRYDPLYTGVAAPSPVPAWITFVGTELNFDPPADGSALGRWELTIIGDDLQGGTAAVDSMEVTVNPTGAVFSRLAPFDLSVIAVEGQNVGSVRFPSGRELTNTSVGNQPIRVGEAIRFQGPVQQVLATVSSPTHLNYEPFVDTDQTFWFSLVLQFITQQDAAGIGGPRGESLASMHFSILDRAGNDGPYFINHESKFPILGDTARPGFDTLDKHVVTMQFDGPNTLDFRYWANGVEGVQTYLNGASSVSVPRADFGTGLQMSLLSSNHIWDLFDMDYGTGILPDTDRDALIARQLALL